MGEKGPNLLSVERAKKLIKELDYSDCKAVIILGNEKSSPNHRVTVAKSKKFAVPAKSVTLSICSP